MKLVKTVKGLRTRTELKDLSDLPTSPDIGRLLCEHPANDCTITSTFERRIIQFGLKVRCLANFGAARDDFVLCR